MSKRYPDHRQHLQYLIGRLGDEAPATLGGFKQLHAGAIANGALESRVKELIPLSIAVCVRGDGCIAATCRWARRRVAGRVVTSSRTSVS